MGVAQPSSHCISYCVQACSVCVVGLHAMEGVTHARGGGS